MIYKQTKFKKCHIQFLYQKGLDCIQQIQQWQKIDKLHLASHYQSKLEMIVELMESITVFHIGDGINGFNHDKIYYTLIDRFHSFKNE